MWLTGAMTETIFQHSSNNFFVDHAGDEESRRDKRTVRWRAMSSKMSLQQRRPVTR